MQHAYPSASYGYYRGAPQFMGQGSDQGVSMSGNGIFSPGQGSTGTTGWSPTILYMFLLIIAEMFVFAFIGRHI